MFGVLNARLGGQGRYRAFPPRVPVEQRYFTLTFVKVGTVTVQESGRKVRGQTTIAAVLFLDCDKNKRRFLV